MGIGTGALAAEEANCVRVVGPQWTAEAQSVDPIKNVSVADVMRITAIYEKLVEIDNDYQPHPVLAESWESNEDGTVWTFRLRKGVTFHDGRPFGAKDVVWSLRRVVDPTIDSGGAAILNMIDPDKVTAVDDHTVQIELAEPVAILPTLLTTKYAAIIPDQTNREDLQKKPVGTGPFMVESFTPGPRFVAQRNPNYWREGKPAAACIELSGIAETVSRTAALTSGQADVLIYLEPAAAATLGATPGVDLVEVSGGTVVNFAMWSDTPPFDDVRVRTAMKLVVDREAFVKTALLGIGVPGNDAPVTPLASDAYRSDVIPRDIEKAKQLLADAGYPDGLSVDLYTSESSPVMVPAAQVYQQMAADAGIKVNVIVSPPDSYWTEIHLKRPFVTSFWGDRPTAEALSVAYLKNTAYPETHWFREDYDALIQKANATMDPGERRALYQQAQKLLAEEGGLILPGFARMVAAVRQSCTGYTPNNNVGNQDFSSLICE
jgi:peptide/nickel transport system substrate-binding protein